MKSSSLFVIALASISLTLAHADETDAFVGRGPLPDAMPAIDGILNKWINEAIESANQHGHCDEDFLRKELRERIHGHHINPKTHLPRAALEIWMNDSPEVTKHHVDFKDSIYSDKRFDQIWRYPVTGITIALADSIQLGNHYVGLDKLNHFVREGLRYYDKGKARAKKSNKPIMESLQEYGATVSKMGRRLENNLQGLLITGVYAYADLAANYSGYHFWCDLLEFGTPTSYIECDPATNQFKLRSERPFTVANYVSDAWDEGINCSRYAKRLQKSVDKVMEAKHVSCPVDWDACHRLASLPEANIYVNPICLDSQASAKAKPAQSGKAPASEKAPKQ